jgi:hypothetical protein
LNVFADADVAVAAVERLIAVAVIVCSAELLAQPQVLRDGGLLGWEVARLRHPWFAQGPLAWIMDACCAYPRVLVLLGVRLALAVALLVGVGGGWPHALLLVALAFVWMVSFLRVPQGTDGADQMITLVLLSLAAAGVAAMAGSRVAWSAALAFIALQAVVSYATAGVAKALSPSWRTGAALPGIAGTDMYGNRDAARFLKARPRTSRLLARGVIVWECAFVLVLLVPMPWAVLIVASGAAFHLVSAFGMGLNTFLWAFLATYPALFHVLGLLG